jgi:hypothetical protein
LSRLQKDVGSNPSLTHRVEVTESSLSNIPLGSHVKLPSGRIRKVFAIESLSDKYFLVLAPCDPSNIVEPVTSLL